MALPQWSRRSLILVASIFAVGGFLLGSSSSQERRRELRPGEVGRYQMVAGQTGYIVFDTRTAHYWAAPSLLDGGKAYPHPDKWQHIGSPFAAEGKPHNTNPETKSDSN